MSAGSVDCLLTFEVSEAASLVVQVAAARRAGLDVNERLEVLNNTLPLTALEIGGQGGGREHLIRAQPGTLEVTYEATVTRVEAAVPEPATAAQQVAALRPSRYCPSDRMAGFAAGHFGEVPAGLDRVRAICGYVWQHVRYDVAVSGSTTDAVETLLGGSGVCRDFAHLVAALCRGVDIPARVAAVYAPGLSPMDFHVVVETAIDGYWYVWDATRLAPRSTLIRIATGRDAADVAFSTVIAGRAELSGLRIGAVAPADLPFDDHDQLVPLG